MNSLQQWYRQILACQVCTFNQAVKLKAWKVEQTSLFYFNQWNAADISGITIGMECSECVAFVMPESLELCTETSVFPLSAYTTAEMIAMIGFQSASAQQGEGDARKYSIGIHINTSEPFTEHLTKPLADALGDLLLFRIEKGQVTHRRGE